MVNINNPPTTQQDTKDLLILRPYRLLMFQSIFAANAGLLAAMALLATFNLGNFSFSTTQKNWPIIVFALICSAGIIMTLIPQKYRRLRRSNHGLDNFTKERKSLKIGGHHPLCGKFSAHIFHLRNRLVCAGCSGLATGAFLAIVGCWVYSFTLEMSPQMTQLFLFSGLSAMYIGILLPLKSLLNRSAARLIVNVAFVLGAFLFLVALIEMQNNMTTLPYFFALLLFSLFVRIKMSEEHHKHICKNCDLGLCRKVIGP
jgi:hypothetical protein